MTAQRQRNPLPLDGLVAALEQPLGVFDDEARRAQIRAYLELGRVHLERAMLDVLARAAESVNAAQGNVEARVELAAGTPEWVVEARDPEPLPDNSWGDGEQEKVTIRIPAPLKQLINVAAARSGVSLNTWYVRVLTAALGSIDGEPSKGPRPAPPAARTRQAGRSLKGIIGR